jgi:hypothetical protein
MGDPRSWPPLEGGRRHPDERLRRAALTGLALGLGLGFAVAWLLL